MNRLTAIVLTYAAVGALAGLLAGLLGIGGGLVVVPMLVFLLAGQGVDASHVMHVALGTSMASILLTSVSSFAAHHRRGAVDWRIVRRITVGVLLGTFSGASVVALLRTDVLKGLLVAFLYYVAFGLLRGARPAPSRELPGRLGMLAAGGVIGAVSSFVGIGGGSLSVPFMVWGNVPIHRAIGTSAAIGFPIAVAGTAGYVVNGLGAEGLPDGSLGYVYLPALAGIAAASVLTAPLGARLAHALPVRRLEQIFALLLIVVATRMLAGLLGLL